jgi:hypothetical protein
MSDKKSRASWNKISLNYKFLQILHRTLGELSFFWSDRAKSCIFFWSSPGDTR